MKAQNAGDDETDDCTRGGGGEQFDDGDWGGIPDMDNGNFKLARKIKIIFK